MLKALYELIIKGRALNYIDWEVDWVNGTITTKGNKGVLGFAYDMNDKCFYATTTHGSATSDTAIFMMSLQQLY